jgi:hypothetical protein
VEFRVAHSFDASPEEVAAVLLDEDFQHSLEDVGALEKRHLLSQEEKPDGTVERRTRCVLGIKINDVARRFIGDGEPAWVEHAVWYPDRMQWEWEIEPEVAEHMLSAQGVVTIGGEDGNAEREVSGKVKISGIPIYGGKAEDWIVKGIESAYDEEADQIARWLSREK